MCALVMALSACIVRPTPLSDYVASAGYPANPDSSSVMDMRLWLQNHHDAAREVKRRCRMGDPSAHPTESRLCEAATLALQIPEGFHPTPGDPRTFDLKRFTK